MEQKDVVGTLEVALRLDTEHFERVVREASAKVGDLERRLAPLREALGVSGGTALAAAAVVAGSRQKLTRRELFGRLRSK